MIGESRLDWKGILLRVPFYLLALTMFMPYYWMVISAFKPTAELSKNPPSFIVTQPTLNNFYDPTPYEPNSALGLFQRFEGAPLRFGTFFLNSLFITGSITLISLLLCSLAAYVIAKHEFPGRNLLFIIILASMMVPWQVNFIPNFLTIKQFGWLDPNYTFLALIIPALPKAMAFFFLRQYIMTIPNDLLDAARIDGANEWQIWWRMILPLIGPALAAVSITIILNEWNNFVWPLIVVQDLGHQTLPVALSQLNTNLAGAPQNMGVLMVASLLISLPAVIVFLSFQKQFIESVASAGLKG